MRPVKPGWAARSDEPMSAVVDNKDNLYSEQLSGFESELRDHIDDEAMLRDMHAAIREMLSGNGASERDVRDLLQKQYDLGELRHESFQLVQKLIDRIVSDDVMTEPVSADYEGDDKFSSTAVIPAVTLEPGGDIQQLQVGSVLRDRFLLQEEVAGGSMGTVYKAMDRRLAEADSGDHWVAVKVLSPSLSHNGDALRALQQEAAKTRCLTHPNIVRFIDLDRDDDLYFMVMEWLDGRSLADILDDSTSKNIDIETALHIVRQVGLALEYAHQRGVIHADVKPANIMITPAGDVKLFDFGVARIQQKQRGERSDFDPGVLKAVTAAYSSMQVLTGEEPVPADDVFSLGCLAYRLIAGYRVFGPRNAAEAAEAGMEPQCLDDLSKSQWQALKKALAYSRVTRFTSPATFVDALLGKKPLVGKIAAIAENEPFFVDDDTGMTRALDTERNPWWIGLLLIALAGAAAFVYQDEVRNVIFRSTQPAADEPRGLQQSGPATPINSGAKEREDETSDEDVSSEATPGGPAASDVEDEPVEVDRGLLPVDPTADIEIETGPTPDEIRPSDVNPNDRFEFTSPATMIIPLPGLGEESTVTQLTLREDSAPAVIDFVRESHLEESIKLRLSEVYFSGNGSPLDAGQYTISNGGLLEFPAGQHKARISITMTSDPLREPDRDVRLVVRDVDYSDIEFATINLELQDDDQRAFEGRLAPNTVGFAVSQVSVRESDTAVQIDLIRYKPDNRPLEATYAVRGVTATEGEDYFDPGSNAVSFAPGQRSVRILIPLVQDGMPESDEAFMLELTGDLPNMEDNIYRRIAVMIRDDDS